MNPVVFFCVFCFYSLFVFLVKRRLYPFSEELAPRPISYWRQGQEHTLIVSPDYWWAFRFKTRLSNFVPPERSKELLKLYVINNNKANLQISALLLVAIFVAYTLDPCSTLLSFLSTVALIRYVSRSYEISYAFGRDVLYPEPPTTGLTKHERIRLALFSYVEIYLYSAAAYMALPTVAGLAHAVRLAMNVGTLTNVGYAFSTLDAPFIVNLVFVQVITTLSLVVLSLAAYLARAEDA